MSNQVLEIIEQRSTTNLYDSTKILSDESIKELVRLATTAPTAFNLQNWKFIAVRTPAEKKRLRAVAWDQQKIEDAAVTFIVCGILPDHNTMSDRLAPVVDAGIMPASWCRVGTVQLKASTLNSHREAVTKQYERQRLVLAHLLWQRRLSV